MPTAVPPSRSPSASSPTLPILFAISAGHLLNDTIQSLLPAVYPLLHEDLNLNFSQIGLITLAFQLTASILQPMVGLYTDRHPQPYSLAAGMLLTLTGVVVLSLAHTFGLVLVAAMFIGFGSSIFHPEASRVARLASGGRHGFAQSVFQVGGNAGSSLGPLLAAFIVLPRGQTSIAWFSIAALVAMLLLFGVGNWYKRLVATLARSRKPGRAIHPTLKPRNVIFSLAILIALIFSKYFYLASVVSYYTFYLISKFNVSVRSAQLHLFLFLG